MVIIEDISLDHFFYDAYRNRCPAGLTDIQGGFLSCYLKRFHGIFLLAGACLEEETSIMIRKKTILFVVSVIFLAGVVFTAVFFNQSDDVIRIGSEQWSVELASTPASRELGLGSRVSLPPRNGMLFSFPDSGPGKYAFWMKGMLFPLDIAWIRDGEVVFLERNIASDSQDILRPPTDADLVLEVNAGEMENIEIGDRVE